MKEFEREKIILSYETWIRYKEMQYLEMSKALLEMSNIDERLSKDEILVEIKNIEKKLFLKCQNSSKKYLLENKDNLLFTVYP